MWGVWPKVEDAETELGKVKKVHRGQLGEMGFSPAHRSEY